MVEFGVCDCDYSECYADGCICRLNPSVGFQFQFVAGIVKPVPFRNKDCCHFHKNEGVSS
jgi:hypothetical protein